MNYVYWIYDDSCSDLNDGYIGVTRYPETRFNTHKRKNRVPSNSKMKIIFEGTREECFEYEKKMRPTSKIGWNSAAGGSHGWRLGFKHSDQTKRLLKEKWTDDRKQKASDLRKEQNKKMTGQKRPKQSIAMSGENNPMFGTNRPDYVKEAVSKSRKGKEPANKQKNYCTFCGERVSLSVMKKYHGPGKKACMVK